MTILVAYGTSRGGTAGLAAMIVAELAAVGRDAVAVPARDAGPVAGHDAVIVAGSLTVGHWHRDARRFVRVNAAALRALPVWIVSSGPLDGTARPGTLPPTPQVAAAIDLALARGHMTFGGYLSPDVRGFPASAFAKSQSGDWRDPEHVHEWVATVDASLAAG